MADDCMMTTDEVRGMTRKIEGQGKAKIMGGTSFMMEENPATGKGADKNVSRAKMESMKLQMDSDNKP